MSKFEQFLEQQNFSNGADIATDFSNQFVVELVNMFDDKDQAMQFLGNIAGKAFGYMAQAIGTEQLPDIASQLVEQVTAFYDEDNS